MRKRRKHAVKQEKRKHAVTGERKHAVTGKEETCGNRGNVR